MGCYGMTDKLLSANPKNKSFVESSGYKYYASNINEIKIMKLDEANEYLQSGNKEYQILDSIPVRTVNNQSYVVMVRRAV
jgi:hypothetical protein